MRTPRLSFAGPALPFLVVLAVGAAEPKISHTDVFRGVSDGAPAEDAGQLAAPGSHPQLNRSVQRQGPRQEMTTNADAMMTFERTPKSRTPKFSSS
jgi:hypothetical protein